MNIIAAKTKPILWIGLYVLAFVCRLQVRIHPSIHVTACLQSVMGRLWKWGSCKSRFQNQAHNLHCACPKPLIRYFRKRWTFWLHFKWAFDYISKHTGTFSCLSVRIVSSGGIKIYSRKIGENYPAYSVRSRGNLWLTLCCLMRNAVDNISRDFDFQTQNRTRHQVFVFQSWKVTLDHIKSHSKFAKRLHIDHCRSLKLVWQSNSVNPHMSK